ncbi:MAG: GHKL domain-containing protein [Bacilli bacterium]|nr:GHKL domain-containing protein [Bacilli bacterium]
MKIIDWTIISLLSIVAVIIQLFTFKELSEKSKIRIGISSIICIIVDGIIITYNSYTNDSILRAFVSFAIIIVSEQLIFKYNIIKTLTYGIMCYILVVVSEIVLDIILLTTKLINLQAIDHNILAKVLLSIIMVLPAYFIARNRHIKNITRKIMLFIENSIVAQIMAAIFLVVSVILAFKNIMSLSFSTYLGNFVLLIVFIILIVIILFKEYRVKRELTNTKILLEFMSKYERKIDEDRINRHEMLNNLLVLKSYKNKNSKEYNDTLDDIIANYSKKDDGIKNIYKLPSGLKGIIYYKINEIKNKNINININISKILSSYFKKLDNKTYTAVCKIVGITFDNAIEACINSNEKIIRLEVYEENNTVIIDIENTFNNIINIKKINNKNYSTKSKNRGLGLYIANNIINNNRLIDMKQYIDNNYFVTKIFISKQKSR